MSITDRIVLNEHGLPVLLADVPNAGVSNVAVGTKSGNKLHDAHSGKFGGGGGGTKSHSPAPPANVDPHEWHRMLASVRDAAREFDHPTEGDLKDFLRGRAKDISKIDIQAFMEMVKHQRIADLADLIDQQMRVYGPNKLGRRKVSITSPKGFMRKSLSNLTPDDRKQLEDTLVSRGHDQAEVDKWFTDRGVGSDSSNSG